MESGGPKQVEALELDKETLNQGCLSKNKKKIIIVALLAVAIATLVGILVAVFGSATTSTTAATTTTATTTTTTTTATTTTTGTPQATIVLSSTAEAAEQQGGRLGEYVQADEEYGGHVYYKQRHDIGSQDVAERRGDGLGGDVQADEENGGHGHNKQDGAGDQVQAGKEYEGRVFHKQRDGNVTSGGNYIFKEGERWIVGETLGLDWSGLRSQETGDLLPPTQNWEYWDGSKWRDDDASLTLTFASLPTPCPMVRVAGEGEVVEKQGSSLGDYRLEKGLWSIGRPIFKKEDEGIERVLFVPEGKTVWSIRTSTSSRDTWNWIQSGRATVSPTMPEAGSSERMNRTGWAYWAEDKWIVGSISVTCIE